MSDNTSSKPTATQAGQPRRRFVHRSTWTIITLALIALLLANLPGSYESGYASIWPTEIHHGWPWIYLERDGSFPLDDDFHAPLWQLNDPKSFDALAALGNFTVGLGMLLTVGILAEWRRRRRDHFWQITLAETLFAVVLVCGGSAVWGWQLKETNRQAAAIMKLSVDGVRLTVVLWESRLPDWWTGDWATEQQPWLGHIVAIHHIPLPYPETSVKPDRVLQSIDQFPALRELLVSGGAIEDFASLQQLQLCSNLQRLDLSETGLNDAALDPIARVSTLVDLDLSHNSFSDDGLKKLQALRYLKYLNLTNTGASDEAVEALQQALPQLEITDD